MNALQEGRQPADERALEQLFESVRRERMAALPLQNERLRVEAVGFRDWRGLRVGALVTPWSINLVLLAAPGTTLPLLATGESRLWAFPSGEYPFEGHSAPGLGAYQQCALLSPVLDFASHADAVAAARAALAALFTAPAAQRVSRRGLLLGA